MKDEKTLLDLNDPNDVKDFSESLGCSEQILRFCARKVGKSKAAIEAYWSMNSDWLLMHKDAGDSIN